jgi:hypothetical protein
MFTLILRKGNPEKPKFIAVEYRKNNDGSYVFSRTITSDCQLINVWRRLDKLGYSDKPVKDVWLTDKQRNMAMQTSRKSWIAKLFDLLWRN